MTKKIKKLEDVKEETTEAVEEQPIEENTEAIVEEVIEEVTEAPTEAELPKVEFNEEVAPKGYSGLVQPQKTKDELRMKNGRVYKEVGNGLGMFLDNGATFRL